MKVLLERGDLFREYMADVERGLLRIINRPFALILIDLARTGL